MGTTGHKTRVTDSAAVLDTDERVRCHTYLFSGGRCHSVSRPVRTFHDVGTSPARIFASPQRAGRPSSPGCVSFPRLRPLAAVEAPVMSRVAMAATHARTVVRFNNIAARLQRRAVAILREII